MPDRFEFNVYDGKGALPLVAMLDATQQGQVASLAAGVTRIGNVIECTGMRRYRLKCLQLTGVGPTRVRALDIAFGRVTVAPWELAVLAAAQATGVRSVYNFGEGTAIMPNMMGGFLAIELQNNGADAATYELEFWMQG